MPFDFMNMPTDESERICYAEGFENAAKLFTRIAELEAERDALAEELEKARERLPFRFFIVDYDLDDGPDIVECDELDFLNASGPIEYKRHTVRENGVNQICLTKCE